MFRACTNTRSVGHGVNFLLSGEIGTHVQQGHVPTESAIFHERDNNVDRLGVDRAAPDAEDTRR